MEISILIFDDLRVERASCDHSKLSKMADQLNGPGCFGPYYSVKIDLEDCDLQQRLATAEAERTIYYEIAAAAIGEEQTRALRDAAMRRKR